jgi:flavin reductase (DIM6/NTAB) family NADH-FMN oxidoreductase RutF
MSSPIVAPQLTGGSRFLEAGAGEAILFIHGAGQDAGFWTPQLELFAPSHWAIALDVEGEDPVAQARRLLDDLAISSANVVAHGGGGAIALALAAAHPQRVRRLALIDTEPASRVICPAISLSDKVGAEQLNRALAEFLGQRLSRFDNRELRTAFGSFMTGVTIVTTAGVDGQPRGFTANSFTSVSLEPPLLMICVGKTAASVDVFRQAAGFAVNILSEAQKETSVLFASKRPDKFEAARWRPGPYGNPLIEGSAAWFDCARYQVIDAGDHIILVGHVEAFSYTDANPLGYARGHYITLGLEQAAVNAASSASRTVVGAILESDSRLVLLPDPARPNGLALPEAGRSGPNGSASQLHELLVREGMDATLGFLFAVFENPLTREQCIYYRGETLLHARGRTVLADFDDIPWDRLPDEATRSMLRRYAAERKIGRFKVYSGDHRQGTVKAVD